MSKNHCKSERLAQNQVLHAFHFSVSEASYIFNQSQSNLFQSLISLPLWSPLCQILAHKFFRAETCPFVLRGSVFVQYQSEAPYMQVMKINIPQNIILVVE